MSFPKNKKIGIIGTGALASFYAAKLSGMYQVKLWGTWQENILALNKGIRFEDESGIKEVNKLEAYSVDDQLPECDIYIWLTKTYQNEERIHQFLKTYQGQPLLILQNGISQLSYFKEVLRSQNIFEGITQQGANMVEAGWVKDAGKGDVIGNEFFHGVFASAGLSYVVENDTSIIKNRKLALNAVINPLSAIHGVENGKLLEGELWFEVKELMVEVFPYFEKRSVFVDFQDYNNEVLKVLRTTALNTNSMLADVKSGRRTEIDSILKPIQEELKSEYLSAMIHSIENLKQTI